MKNFDVYIYDRLIKFSFPQVFTVKARSRLHALWIMRKIVIEDGKNPNTYRFKVKRAKD